MILIPSANHAFCKEERGFRLIRKQLGEIRPNYLFRRQLGCSTRSSPTCFQSCYGNYNFVGLKNEIQFRVKKLPCFVNRGQQKRLLLDTFSSRFFDVLLYHFSSTIINLEFQLFYHSMCPQSSLTDLFCYFGSNCFSIGRKSN